MKYISDVIGDEYKTWGEAGAKSIIAITAPTGSGKTTFVINQLYRHACATNRKILYLVNRTVLKKQIEEDFYKLFWAEQFQNVGLVDIRVETYQTLEYAIKNGWVNSWEIYSYDYVICDEAHYFLKDALFNTNTYFSYCTMLEIINGVAIKAEGINTKAVILISATIDKVLDRLKMDCVDYKQDWKKRLFQAPLIQNAFCKYEGSGSYDYLNIKSFRKIDDIPEIISNDNVHKWWIFLNDIDRGKKLNSCLIDKGIDSIFVDSDFNEDEAATLTVRKIAEQNIMNHRVIIATSVMDNGISVCDVELRNMIVLAENYEDFIQMIGRKRTDGERVNLYLCLHNKLTFANRLQQLKNTQKIVEECISNPLGVYEKLLKSSHFQRHAKRFLYVTRMSGCMMYCMNRLSVTEIANNAEFYREAIQQFDVDGDYAFLKIQLNWLGKSLDEVNEIVLSNTQEERYKETEKLKEILELKLNLKMSSAENKELKKQVKEGIKKLLQLAEKTPDEYLSLKESIGKGDRALSADKFNEAMQIIGLQYRMVRNARSTIIKLVEDKEIEFL